MKVATEVLAVLADAECDGPYLRITEQLDRPLYVATNKVLVAAGGKWTSGKIKAHVFAGDAADAVDQVVLTGEIMTGQDLGWFPTPFPVVERMIAMAGLAFDGTDDARRLAMSVLEPSAGEGAIAEFVPRPRRIDCVEIDEKRCAVLSEEVQQRPYRSVRCADFLTLTPYAEYDRVVMNPPFARQADMAHVAHAFRFLRPGGRLVSVMSLGVTFRRDAKTVDFRAFIEAQGGTITVLPEDAFKPSGTKVRTVLVSVDRGEP